MLKTAKIHRLDLVLLHKETKADKSTCRFLKLKEMKTLFQDGMRYYDVLFFQLV